MLNLIKALRSFYCDELKQNGFIALHEPVFNQSDRAYVVDCLETGWVSSAGAYIAKFEESVIEICGARFGVATVNGTAALHVTLHALGVAPSDLVLCPALSFIATANAIAYCGAEPFFVDAEVRSLGMDPAKVEVVLACSCERRNGQIYHRETGRRVAAIVPMHVFGHPVDMDPLLDIAAAYGIPVVEDAAESLGSRYKDKPCGALARAGILSFNGNKPVTTGGGGMIVTNDEALARRLKHLTTTARVGSGWTFDHDEIGFNYRLPNINAALGLSQMQRFADTLKKKRELARRLNASLGNVPGIDFFWEQDWAASNYWLNAILCEDANARDAVLQATNDQDIQTRPCWRLLCDLPMYTHAPCGDDLPVARDIVARLVNIPSSPQLLDNIA